MTDLPFMLRGRMSEGEGMMVRGQVVLFLKKKNPLSSGQDMKNCRFTHTVRIMGKETIGCKGGEGR